MTNVLSTECHFTIHNMSFKSKDVLAYFDSDAFIVYVKNLLVNLSRIIEISVMMLNYVYLNFVNQFLLICLRSLSYEAELSAENESLCGGGISGEAGGQSECTSHGVKKCPSGSPFDICSYHCALP